MPALALTLDVGKATLRPYPPIKLIQGEKGLALFVTITDNGKAFDLTGKTVRFMAMRPDGYAVVENAVVANAAAGEVSYALPSALAGAPGLIDVAYLAVYDGDVRIAATQYVEFAVGRGADVNAARAGDYVTVIDDLMADCHERVGSAVSLAEDAAAVAGSATAKASGAADKASASAARANEAAESASAAAADALLAAEEARASIDPDKRIYLTYEAVGDVEYITLVDTED